MAKIVAISDTHRHDLKGILKNYKADILLIAGDLTYSGTLAEMKEFQGYLKSIRDQFTYIAWINGNHEVEASKHPRWMFDIAFETNTDYLENSLTAYIIDGKPIKIWGSPVTPSFGCGWAYNIKRGNDIKKYWEMIPSDTDVVMTHGMPFGFCDEVESFLFSNGIEHVGCRDLRKKIYDLKPKVVLGGHLHRDKIRPNWNQIFGPVRVLNVSICDDTYKPTNKPVEFSL